MYIEFSLPNGSAGQAAAHSLIVIRKQLVEWSIQHNIPYNEKLSKYILKVTFEDPNHYTFFGLTWEPRSYAAKRYRLVEPMDPPPK